MTWSTSARVPQLVLTLLACASANTASADTRCADLPNPLYLQIGDTQEPLIKELGRSLRDSQANPLTLIYQTSGSCTNIEAIYTGVPLTSNPKYLPSQSEDANWKTSDPSPTCTIDDAGHAVDVANSALFVSACNPDDPPQGVKLFQGPIQGYGFIVPEASTQRGITAEEAYFVFGFGEAGKAEPWTDEEQLFIRTTTKSTLLSMAAAIHVPGNKWHGKMLDGSADVLNGVINAPDPEKAIGIYGMQLYDRNRDKLNLLAFQAFGQHHAYYPDSSVSSFDKRNVRDGHYLPWSPTVWITHVDDAGEPTDARAKYLIGLILGESVTPKPNFEPLDAVIKVGLVPDCAMRVSRTQEGGDLSLYRPDAPCDCYFESKVGTPTASCKACDGDDDCHDGSCRHGFCEAK